MPRNSESSYRSFTRATGEHVAHAVSISSQRGAVVPADRNSVASQRQVVQDTATHYFTLDVDALDDGLGTPVSWSLF